MERLQHSLHFPDQEAGKLKRANARRVHPQLTVPKVSFDIPLMIGFLLLMTLGLVMVTSASAVVAEQRYGSAYYFAVRQSIFMLVAVASAAVVFAIPMRIWQRYGTFLLGAALLLLCLVLVPGIGQEINGSRRWIDLGPASVQPSEFLKFCMIVYVAGFLVRHAEEVRHHYRALVVPLILLFAMFGLILLQPDLGTVIVLLGSLFVLMFLGGVRLVAFVILLLCSLAACFWLISSTPYRFERLVTFQNPWADALGSGYQLSHSLIAFGRGQLFGSGLGHSIQKHLYLPEGHTDFIFAIIGEELGFFGVLLVLSLFFLVFIRMLAAAGRAELIGSNFNAYIIYGIAVLLGLQVFINMGVSMGILPTKGLTLPFISYGGSSLLVCCMMAGLALRAVYELNRQCRQDAAVTAGVQ